MRRYAALLLLFATTVVAQPSTAPSVWLRGEKKLKIISCVDLDTLYLRAWDSRGKPDTTFRSDDVRISNHDDSADIISFERDSVLAPTGLALNFVLDNSSSMFHSYDSLTKYLDSTLDSLGVGAEVSAVAFDNIERKRDYESTSRDRLFLAPSGFNTNYTRIKSFWHFFDSIRSDYTPLFDAAWSSFEHIAERRKSGDSLASDVMIVVTDGDDNCSEISIERLLALAKVMRTTMFVVNYRSEPDGRIIWLVNHTSGSMYSAETLGELRATLREIRKSLTTGYKIIYKFPFRGAGKN